MTVLRCVPTGTRFALLDYPSDAKRLINTRLLAAEAIRAGTRVRTMHRCGDCFKADREAVAFTHQGYVECRCPKCKVRSVYPIAAMAFVPFWHTARGDETNTLLAAMLHRGMDVPRALRGWAAGPVATHGAVVTRPHPKGIEAEYPMHVLRLAGAEYTPSDDDLDWFRRYVQRAPVAYVERDPDPEPDDPVSCHVPPAIRIKPKQLTIKFRVKKPGGAA